MKRIAILIWVLLVAGFAVAQDATIVFVDGFVDIQTEAGALFPADFGDELSGGDRVITDRDSEAELELATGGDVTVAPDTVFIVGATTTSTGQRTGRLTAAIGSFSFRFNAAIGNEPSVGSTTSVAGVRGTEVRVYTGSDGTTRFEVIEGLVEISDSGSTVTLGAEEAVEVRPGSAPGTVFAFLEQPIDYGAWNASLVDDFLADPITSLDGIAAEMRDLISEVERRGPVYDEAFAAFVEERDKLPGIEEKDGADARVEYAQEVVTPLRVEARDLNLELRYVVLSALSLDQFVLSRLAAEMDAAFFLNPTDATYNEFQTRLAQIRAEYERVVSPRLSATDL